ncbi:hypothetical protein NQ315_017208 [Exocentrus adspersus]|uniref:Glutamate receptor ionotropic, kainate 2 n=1 Tax=Exocentrus adspersus TaxID=1586481 RepID=A0AAV8VA22_9CUCU|nr:hypothetical protein NQ315_017208 [Exocentrus adspersus]
MVRKVTVSLLCFVYIATCYCGKQVYKIGGLFIDEHQKRVFETATGIVNKNLRSSFKLEAHSVVVDTRNSLLTYNEACKLLRKGIVGLFGPSSVHSSPYIQSLCDLKEIPHLETHRYLNLDKDHTLVNIHPHPKTLSKLYFNLVEAFDWHSFIILYDNYENLLSVSSLLEFNSLGRTVVLRQLQINEKSEIDGYRPLLTQVKLTGETKYILVCSTNILETVLQQLQQVGMMTDIYRYIIANLDMQTVELQPFQYAGTNITGVRVMDPESKTVVDTVKRVHRSFKLIEDKAWKLDLESALIVDAVQLFYETIFQFTEDQKSSIRTKPIDCKSYDSWTGGYTIINSLKTNSVGGLTGSVKFDPEGFRTSFNVDILELTPRGLVTVGEWNSTDSNIKSKRVERVTLEGKKRHLFNRTFTVLISLSKPYAMLKENTAQLTGNDRYEGFCVDVIDELARILGFNYTFTVQEDGANGNLDKLTNEWNGMIGEIIKGTADLAITDLTITSERETAVDFTMPFMNLGISILYKKPEPVPPSLLMFVSPFSVSVWVMLGVSYFVVSITIFVMGRLSPREWQNPFPCVEEPEYLINQFTIRNSLWFTIGALMQQGSELAPIAISTRTASGIWWFFVLIMVSSYTANLAAFLTVETLVTPFKNINELAAQKKSNTALRKTEQQLITSDHPENMVTLNEDGVNKVETEDYAFLMESTSIEYATERKCTLAQVGGLLDDKGYGIAMAKDSAYRNDLSRAVLRLQETGVLTGLKIKWWKEKRGGGKCSRKPEGGEATALDLQNVGGVFLVLFIGALLGFFGSFMELLLYVYQKSKVMSLPFKQELKRELKFFVELKQNVKVVSEEVAADGTTEKSLLDYKL